MQFRREVFNVTNDANFALPTSTRRTNYMNKSFPTKLTFLFLFAAGCVCARGASAPALGSVTELKEPCPGGAGPGAGAVCRQLQVACPGLNPIAVQIRMTEPAAGVPLRGTVVLGSGAGGSGFYAGGGERVQFLASLNAMGFRVVDRAWTGTGKNGWTTSEAGLRKESCRYATLLTWVHDHVHKGGKFVATGNSGGSAEIGYALTSWGRAAILDLAIPTSGPPTAHLDYACVKQATPQWASLCASIVPANTMQCPKQNCILGAAQLAPGGVCTQTGSQPTPEQLLDDSVVNPDAVLDYPKTLVHFIYGKKDCGEPVPIGLTYATKVTSRKVIEFVPNTPHEVASTPEGRAAILKAIDDGTK